ncbi:hypothetical protein BC831DRAFT_475811 [Entophlyctis helioformis]|nr:hypothetical protein BC831DRAFT_475811 [Entophlyctis helioformis]
MATPSSSTAARLDHIKRARHMRGGVAAGTGAEEDSDSFAPDEDVDPYALLQDAANAGASDSPNSSGADSGSVSAAAGESGGGLGDRTDDLSLPVLLADGKDKKLKSKRMGLYRNDRVLSNMCHNNGITEINYVTKLESINSIEMCHFNMPSMAGFHYFPFLTSLCIVAQDIKEIVGLETCENLGLERCTELKRLYSNRIRHIDGLSNMTKLEELWLSDNEIAVLENLSSLKRLTSLQLGNNRIMMIGNALNDNVGLKDLNLSGNRISSFREILNLTRLPNLTHLCLSDPNFADNPICALCNYQTHVVYHLPNLKFLDTLEVTEESRRIISATILKKRMQVCFAYYNMRIRTIRRNTNFLIKTLDGVSAADQKTLETDIELLMARSKRVQKKRDELAAAIMLKVPTDPDLVAKLENARFRINTAIENKTRTLMNLLTHRSDIYNQIMNQSDMAIRKLLLELETGGNVRFEDEQKDDPWVVECENLVKIFIKRAVSKHSPRTIQIHRISRLHNRHMKLKFEDRFAKLPESDKSSHLCFHGRQSNSDDVFSVVEHGCQLVPGTTIFANGVLLSNFLDCHEDKGTDTACDSVAKKTLRQAIIVRSIPANVSEVAESSSSIEHVNADHYPGRDGVCQRITNRPHIKGNTVVHGEYPKEYFVFDRDVLLPEYFIEYSLESDLDRYTTQLERLMVDIAYSNRMSHSDMPNIVSELSLKLTDMNEPLRVMANDIPMAQLEQEYPEITMADSFKQSSTEMMETMISKSSIALEHINIGAFSVHKPETYANRTLLRSLTVSHAGLESMPTIPKLALLERLDLSFNSISSMSQGLEGLPHLRYLDLAGNRLADLASLRHIFKAVPNLVVLDLRFNPICRRKGYRQYCLSHAPTLQILDAVQVEKSEREPVDWQPLFASKASPQQHLFRPLSMRTQTGYGSSSAEHEHLSLAMVDALAHQHHHQPQQEISLLREPMVMIPPDQITTFELDSCNLFDLDKLPDRMPSLRWASFRNNNLQDVSKLASYHRLEELSLENNEITSIDVLARLELLTKLDVSNNKISSVDSAANFRSLMLFSLENNLIKSMRPFAKMSTLMEFYIGNNLVVDLFSIFPLKELPRLIILDLTGNAVCKINNYRLFTVFHLGRLKILDGAGITSKEQQQAKDIYMGKLTIELLGEKIGHFTFKNISELDLRNCKIREIDCLTNGDFRNLRRLNFDNNLLSNIDCFTSLSGLRYLSLNTNRIERLLSTDPLAPVPSSTGGMSGLVNLGNSGTGNGAGSASATGMFGAKIETVNEFGKLKTLLPHLEELYLGYNQVARIADLALYRMPNLKILFLQGNRISRIDGLEHMTSLIELVLDKNQIKGADPLSFLSLINLKELHIKENRIRSLAHFDCLPNLQMLYLANNRVHEMSEIEKMKLPSLLEISLAANAIARKQLYRIALVIRFPQIFGIDGKEVTEEERHRAHAYYFEQCLMREDPVAKLVASGTQGSQNVLASLTSSSAAKHPVKITSVVLDGGWPAGAVGAGNVKRRV